MNDSEAVGESALEHLKRNWQTARDEAFRPGCVRCIHRSIWARSHGECHLDGPVIGENGFATWPKVRDEDSCSRFEPNEETIAQRKFHVEREREREDALRWRERQK